MNHVLILGARSDIARATAALYARQGYDLYLAARCASELEAFAADLRIRYHRHIQCIELDVLEYLSHEACYASFPEKPVGVICAVGYLGHQEKAQHDFDECRKIIDSNFTGLVSFLNIVARDFEARQSGFIICISSVAGDRGRKSNYIYGAAKAGLTAYLSGLRNRLHKAGVTVMTVKPGFVETKMTQGMPLPPLLTAQPNKVAQDIFQGQKKGRDILYTKWIWKWVMIIVRFLPERLFKRLSI